MLTHGAALHVMLLKYDRFLPQQQCVQQIALRDMARDIDCRVPATLRAMLHRVRSLSLL